MLKLKQSDVDSTLWLSFEGRDVRVVNVKDGSKYYVACDIQDNILGVSNISKLLEHVDHRCKAEAVITFVEDFNAQRYNLVDLDGLRWIIFRARKCEVDRLAFVKWVESKDVL